MRARVVARDDVRRIADLLRARGYDVFALFRDRGNDTYFDLVTNENHSQMLLHGPNPCNPPKRFVLPHIEPLMTIRKNGGVHIEPNYDHRRRAVFGMRSCDVSGIQHLDRFFLGREVRDIYYENRRRDLFVVNFACTDPVNDIGEQCFCVCADTGPAARDHFDLQLVDLGQEYMAVAGSKAGEELFRDPIFRHGASADIERRRTVLEKARRSFKTTTSWFSATVRYISQDKTLENTWEEIGNRCIECGGCTFVCPTCTCFTVSDRNIGPDEVERIRIWDSCALGGFTRMAGGHNPRRAVHDRRNRRFFRKLAHFFVQRELSVACVGCGRCAAVCHGEIGMPSVVEMIRRATAEEHEPASH